jgi:DNA polymerase III sliding clamp (beta) subunit (PCNA family)
MEMNRKQLSNALKVAKTFQANAVRINVNGIIAQSDSGVMKVMIDAIGGTNTDVTFNDVKELQKAIATKKTPFVTITENDNGTATIDEMIRLNTIDESLNVTFSGEHMDTITIGTESLQKAITNTSTFVSDDKMTPILCGVNMYTHGFSNEMIFRATNRHYAAQYTIKGNSTDAYANDSRTFDVNMMKAIATLKTNATQTHIYRSEKWTHFVIGADTFTARNIDGVYPDFEKIYSNAKQSSTSSIVFNIYDLIEIMTALTKTTADKKAFATKLHYTDGVAKFTDKDNAIAARMDAHAHGIDGDYNVAFNGKYMLNILKTLHTENVTLNVSKSSVNPLWIGDELPNDETYEILLLPFRM